jgi:hypothetical protein
MYPGYSLANINVEITCGMILLEYSHSLLKILNFPIRETFLNFLL